GLRGPNVTFNQREASGLGALAFGIGALREGRVPAMIVGGADWIEETFFKVHDRFRALSPMRRRRGDCRDEAARPFDAGRNGFVLGEGAFLLVIESRTVAARRGARIYGELLGIGAAGSPAGLNRWPSDAAGLARAMRLAL